MMPDNKKQSKSSNDAPKIMDVINKRSHASATSRPVITNKQPQDDPMMIKKSSADTKHKLAYDSANAPSSDDAATSSETDQSQKTTLSVHHAVKLEPIDPHKVGEVFTPSDNKKTEKDSDEPSPAEDDKKDSESSAQTDAPPKPDDIAPNTDEAEADDSDKSSAEKKTPDATDSPSEDDSAEPAETPPADNDKPTTSPDDAADATSSDKQTDEKDKSTTKPKDSIVEQEVLEPIDLLRDQTEPDHGSAQAMLLGLLIIILLAIVAIDLALDAGLIDLAAPHTHFFSS